MRATEDAIIHVVRNEVDPDHEYHCDALGACFPESEVVDYPAGERVPLESTDGVVLTGSTAGVYEVDTYPWMSEQKTLVRELVERSIPTLGVCFGHQIVNSALGGTVEHEGTTASLVEATLQSDPLFDGVSPVVVSLHGDVVTETGHGLDVIASAEHARVFATRHRSAPLWTVQFHPEVTADLRSRLIDDFGWDPGAHTFDDVDAHPVFENFKRIVAGAVE